MPRSRKYQEWLLESLKDHDNAVAYLNAALEECNSDDEESQQVFLTALRNVADAHGMANVARKAQVGRESLYKTLSPTGNPEFRTLRSLLMAMGLRMRFS